MATQSRNTSRPRQHQAALVEQVFEALAARIDGRRTPLVVGVCGSQGSGKSTLSAQITALTAERGLSCAVLSLDDFYLSLSARGALAREAHPLFITRGVPGTHDIALMLTTLARLKRGRGAVRWPRFDKGLDTRMPPQRWNEHTARPQLILIEGWCIGVPAQREAQLRRAVNALERDEDLDMAWRRTVNTHLRRGYARLWRQIDLQIFLQAPDFDTVCRWRQAVERELRDKPGAARAMDQKAVARFMLHYERLTRHALEVMPARSDIVLELDAMRRSRELLVRSQSVVARRRTAAKRT